MTDRKQETVLEQLGGFRGLVYSTLPILVFVPVNAVWHLTVAIWAALGAAVAILLWRLATGGRIQPAISGFIGVAICAFIAHRTGTAKGYFLFGIYTSLAYGAVFLVSMVVRWPLVGVLWNYVNGKSQRWRSEPRAMRAYQLATVGWVLVFGARYVVQSQLYAADHTGWLAVARILMGWPLAGLAFIVTFAAVRHADRILPDESPAAVDTETSGEVAADSRPRGDDAAPVEPGGVTTATDGSPSSAGGACA